MTLLFTLDDVKGSGTAQAVRFSAIMRGRQRTIQPEGLCPAATKGPISVLLGVALVIASGFAVTADVRAADETSVTTGKEALRGASFPWYDAEKDDARTLRVAPYQPADDGNRDSQWTRAWTPRTTTAPTATPSTGGSMFSMLNILGITALLAAITAVIYFLVKAVMRDDDGFILVDGPSVTAPVPPQLRVAELPVPVPTTTGDFLSEVRRHAAAGNFGLAIVYLFSYELLQLDRHEVIRLSKGKTNRQYLREANPRPDLRTILEPTMIAFEDFFFGRHDLDQQRFENCWTKIDEFHRLLERAAV